MSAFKALPIVLLLSLCPHAAATLRVLATNKTCPAVNLLMAEISQVPFPEDWTIVLACTRLDWEKLQRTGDAQAAQRAFSNLEGKITVVNGAIFYKDDVGRPVHRVLLHETGHIHCRCGNEDQAERWALEYERIKRMPAVAAAQELGGSMGKKPD